MARGKIVLIKRTLSDVLCPPTTELIYSSSVGNPIGRSLFGIFEKLFELLAGNLYGRIK